jgi:imidazolonepropionase-like amidohydrolase
MQLSTAVSWILSITCFSGAAPRLLSQTSAPKQGILLASSTVFDGKGSVLHDVRVVVRGLKIVAIEPGPGWADYDLRGLTLFPGLIDAHVHITWSFGKDGRKVGTESAPSRNSDQKNISSANPRDS